MGNRMTGYWRDQSDAMDAMQKELGLEPNQLNTAERDLEWKKFETFLKHYKPLTDWTCDGQNCKAPLTMHTMIRCADCKAVFCEPCVKAHFKSPSFPKDL